MRIARFLSKGALFTGTLLDDRSARLIKGNLLGDYSVTNEVVPIDRLLAPIVPTDILCIGLNYHAHALETKSTVPENPMLFIKSGNALHDPNAPIILPRNSQQIDFEGELVVVIGRACKHVSRADALNYVLGYTIGNDVSARDWQKEKHLNGGQFARGKSFDTFAPIGPWLVTPDEVPDPNALNLKTVVSGETLQQSTTADMIFDVATIIASLSSTMTIRAGSIIFTGTPSGVGVARTPQRFLRNGDTVDISIDKLGTLSNPVVAE
jgi:2-keto-4-pentenoate hydratase/2-oxohepta-3-ene-1,7-dioic acid hydratase in catechol pathway